GARGELLRHRGGGRLPGGGPPWRDAAGVVQRELEAADPVRADVGADDGLGATGYRSAGRLRVGPGQDRDQHRVGFAQDRDQYRVGFAQHPDGLDRDQLRVAGPDPHADQALHAALSFHIEGTFAQAAVNLAAAAGWPAQWVCRYEATTDPATWPSTAPGPNCQAGWSPAAGTAAVRGNSSPRPTSPPR